MTWFREYSPKVYIRSGDMRPTEVATVLHGFSTVYAFSEEHANLIKASGSSKGLNKLPVYADCITFDLDNGDKCLKELVEWFAERGLGYKIYESGSKGYHFSSNHTPIYDINLPYTHRLLAEAIGVEYDPTLYQAGRILRNVGTIHEKSGRPKQLIEAVEGDAILEIGIRQPPERRFNIRDVEDAELLPFLFDSLSNLMGKSPDPGRRHTTVWGLAKDASRCGLSYETTLELLLTANATWGSLSKEPEYILNAVTQGWDG